ncbi:MAG: phospholipid-binding protein MlaC [Candidatus Sumerlaeia bacterium]
MKITAKAVLSLMCITVLLALSASAGWAADEDKEAPYKDKEASEVIKIAVGKLQEEVRKEGIDSKEEIQEQRERIYNILLDVVDMKTVGILTLARYRKDFSDEQFDEFLDIFYKLMFSTYITHLHKMNNEPIKILNSRKRGDDKMTVEAEITTTDGTKVPLEFSMLQKDGQWWIYDLKAEGVSIVRNYRSQFRELLFKNSVDEFIEKLDKKSKELEEKAITEVKE